MESEESQTGDFQHTDGSVTLSAQELLSLVEKTISSRLAKEEPKAKMAKLDLLRYKGNQKQLDFNCSVRGMVSKALKCVESGEVSGARDYMLNIKEEIDARNKMVRLADRSGWDVVDEYMGDEIASDSEDERKIRSAEQRAYRKRRGSSNSRPFRMGARGRWSRAGSQYYQGEYPVYGRQLQPGFRSIPQYTGPITGSLASTTNHFSKQGSSTGKGGNCYYCGKTGHWAMECDQRKK